MWQDSNKCCLPRGCKSEIMDIMHSLMKGWNHKEILILTVLMLTVMYTVYEYHHLNMQYRPNHLENLGVLFLTCEFFISFNCFILSWQYCCCVVMSPSQRNFTAISGHWHCVPRTLVHCSSSSHPLPGVHPPPLATSCSLVSHDNPRLTFRCRDRHLLTATVKKYLK